MVIHAGVFYHDLRMVTRIVGGFEETLAPAARIEDDMIQHGGAA
jgi:hypothetical protein